MKKALKLITFMIIAGIMLSACTVNLNRKADDQQEDIYEDKYDVIDKGPVKGGTVRLFSTPVDTLNPILTNNQYVQDFLGMVFEGLYRLDVNQQPVPVLAESSYFSPDGLKLTVALKKNVKWHDKMPLKPEDVVFTINTILNVKNNSIYAGSLQNIASAAAGGGNTVIITLKKPDALMLYQLTFPVIPMHYFLNEKIDVRNSKRNLSPVGTGPYSFVSYSAKNGVKLKLNEEWWNRTEVNTTSQSADTQSGNTSAAELSVPYIQSVEVKIYPNPNKAGSAFQSRDVDVVTADPNEFKKYIGRTDISLKRYPGKNYEFLSLNIKNGPMADKNLRNAVNGFIDRKKLVDTAASGIASPAELPLIPNSWIYQLVNPDKDSDINSDIKGAKQLMIQSGYALSSKNKYVSSKNSRALSLHLIVNQENALRVNTANAIAAQLGKIGITVQVEKLTWDNVQNRIKSGSYDMALLGYRISSVPDLSFAYSTAQIATGLNKAGYSNAAVDSYLQQILTQSDVQKQKTAYTDLLNAIMADRPYIGLYFLNEGVMFSKNIRGAINPYVWNKYNDISQWYLPQ